MRGQAERPVVRPDGAVVLHALLRQLEHEVERELGHVDRVRLADDGQRGAALVHRRNIDIVVADAEPRDDLQLLGGADHVAADLGAAQRHAGGVPHQPSQVVVRHVGDDGGLDVVARLEDRHRRSRQLAHDEYLVPVCAHRSLASAPASIAGFAARAQ